MKTKKRWGKKEKETKISNFEMITNTDESLKDVLLRIIDEVGRCRGRTREAVPPFCVVTNGSGREQCDGRKAGQDNEADLPPEGGRGQLGPRVVLHGGLGLVGLLGRLNGQGRFIVIPFWY